MRAKAEKDAAGVRLLEHHFGLPCPHHGAYVSPPRELLADPAVEKAVHPAADRVTTGPEKDGRPLAGPQPDGLRFGQLDGCRESRCHQFVL
jgi:hypothetical protein